VASGEAARRIVAAKATTARGTGIKRCIEISLQAFDEYRAITLSIEITPPQETR
jgi:hypothetical protein